MDEDIVKKGIKIKHDTHHGYIHNNKLNCFDPEQKKYVEHNLDHDVLTNEKLVDEHQHDGYQMVKHNDHYDYVVENRLHYVHGKHCHDHGYVDILLKSEIEELPMIEAMNMRTYWRFVIMIFLTGSFFLVELVVGILINSLALQADAFHMLADLMALIIAFYSVILIKKLPTDKATFGWIRAEIIGALVNGVFLIASCLFIGLESIEKFRTFKELEDTLGKEVDLLLIVGSVGLLINIIGVVLFLTGNHSHSHGHSHGHQHSLNIRALILHMMGDILGSVSVIGTGLLIKLLDSVYRFLADPLVSILIVFLILFNAIPLVKQCIHILLQKVPKHINVKDIKKEISEIEGVESCHHLHIWQLNDARVIGTVHIMLENDADFYEIFKTVQNIMHSHGVANTTIQPEIYDEKGSKNIECDKPQSV